MNITSARVFVVQLVQRAEIYIIHTVARTCVLVVEPAQRAQEHVQQRQLGLAQPVRLAVAHH